MSLRARFCTLILCLAFGGLSWPALGQIDGHTSSMVDTLVDEAVGDNAPGIAVGIVVDGAIEYSRYAGLATLDFDVPIGARTRFNVASNAKQFTALMVLELAHDDRIDLSADFRTYLPEALPGVDRKISVHHLLTHTSGIRDIYDLWALTGVTWYERPFRNRDAMKLLNRQTQLNFEPGTDYLYSNSNYVLLAELISKVSGLPFHQHASKFFAARRMDSTGVARRYGAVIPHRARAYGQWSGWLEDPAIANLHGDGFLYSTLPDQLSWEAQVWGEAPTLPSALIEKSQGVVPELADGQYGYGLEHGEYKGLPTVFHVGSTGGYNAYTVRFPSEKTSIVVMGNSTQVGVVNLGNRIADEVLADALSDDGAFPTGPEVIGSPSRGQDYVGLYEIAGSVFVRVVMRGDELYREIEGREPVRLIPDQGNVYRYENDADLKIAFYQDQDGVRSFEIFSASQSPQRAREIIPAPEGERYRKSLEGIFVNPETDTEIIIRHVSAEQFAMVKNGRERTLRLVGDDYLIWNAYRISVQLITVSLDCLWITVESRTSGSTARTNVTYRGVASDPRSPGRAVDVASKLHC